MTAPIAARQPRDPLDPLLEQWLQGGNAGAMKFLSRVPLADVWGEQRDRILAEHVERSPGTRPLRWWEYDAVEPRLRLGGVGTPLHEFTAYSLVLRCGIPMHWRRSGDFCDLTRIDPLRWPPIDPNDPPRYESQAAYLKRLDLLLPDEARRLHRADFQPEAV
jgi:hypothetical protein